MQSLLWVAVLGLLSACAVTPASPGAHPTPSAAPAAQSPSAQSPVKQEAAAPAAALRLGNFSVSLAVKDIKASRAFYEKLGFRALLGDEKKNWLILQNETCTLGLFQGMFEKNTLTFNPGWDRACNTLEGFDDVRAIQSALKAQGLTLALEAEAEGTGPASLMLLDPDGNPVLIDQHVARPKR